MADIASLGIKVTTDGVQQAASDLDKLGKAADSAADGVQSAAAAAQKSRNSFQSGAAPVKQYRDELSRLLGQIDPVTKKLQDLDKQEERLRKFRAAGAIDSDTFADYAKKIEQARTSLTGFSDSTGKAALSSKQLAQATRQLPMQFTDIATGLASGQKPLQVLLQQGGQLKDTFGGIGPALRASAGYIIGLINPMTVLAAAAAALALAWKQGSDELVGFNQALARTGGYVGRTAQDLQALTTELDLVAGISRGAASEALLKTAASGRFAGDQFLEVSRAAALMASATGQSVDETIKKFVELGRAPVDALLRLNETEHFLTQAQLDRVRALEDEGREQEAVAEAIRIYSDNLSEVARKSRDALPAMEKGWRAIKDEITGAWGELGVYLNLVSEFSSQNIPGFSTGGFLKQFATASLPTTRLRMFNRRARQELRPDFSNVQGSPTVDSAAERARMEAEKEREKQRESFMAQELRYLDDKARKTRDIADVEALVTKGVITREEATKRITQIEDAYARRASKGSRAKEVDEEARALEQLIRRFESMSDQLDRQVALYGNTSHAAAAAYDIQVAGLDKVNRALADQIRGKAQMLDMLELMEEAERVERDNAEAHARRMENNAQLISDMQFELNLLGLSNEAREREIALRYLSADATEEQIAAVSSLADQLTRAREADQNWNELSRNMAQSFQDILDGSVRATDGIKNFFDSLNSQILRNITQDWADALTDWLKTLGSASAGAGGGGGWIAGLLGAFGFASGGYTGNAPRNAVAGVVHGQEYVLNAATTRRLGRSNLDALNAGGSLPGGGVTQVVNFAFTGRMDRRSQSAIASAMYRETTAAAGRR